MVGSGYLKFVDFKNLIDHNPQIKEVSFDNRGEMFFNKDLLQIIEYGAQKSIKMFANGGVNLIHVDDGYSKVLSSIDSEVYLVPLKELVLKLIESIGFGVISTVLWNILGRSMSSNYITDHHILYWVGNSRYLDIMSTRSV